MSIEARSLPGERLHLHHGPIDLIIGADGARHAAFAAAQARFETVLEELVAELPELRLPMSADVPPPLGAIAGRMDRAVRPHAGFVTRMAAVAGAVADTVLAAMLEATPLTRAYVNNGGDIALHLTGAARFTLAMASTEGRDLGRIDIGAGDGIGGIATSGWGGRSLSLGIADSVTVLARNAAQADIAATLIANAVDLPGHPGIDRRPANTLFVDSDLGARPVTVGCAALTGAEAAQALGRGQARAAQMRAAGQISSAALYLQGATAFVGTQHQKKDLTHA